MTRTLLIILSGLFASSVTAEKPVLALVIDDLGYSFEQARQVINLPGEHTYAIIPNTTYAKKIAQFAYKNGREVILHMPMQSAIGRKIEASALDESMSEDEITQSVAQMISDMPHIKGVNNHMGSRLTELGYVMRPVMETIKQMHSGFYFLDSRTTPLSKAYQQALRAGVPTLKRDVFLDFDHINPESIEFQIRRWQKKADNRGYAVAIGHPHQTTIDQLQQTLPQSLNQYQYMNLSQLIEFNQQEPSTWPKYLSHLQQDSKKSKPLP